MKIKVSVPATSANIGSGFDALGLAVTLFRRDDLEVISIGTTALRLQLCSLPLWAFITLRRRGDKPSVLRLISWIVGLMALFYVTSGALTVYGKIQFSVHMVDHMSLTMIVPIFLVLGAPVRIRACWLRTKPSCSMAAITRSLVST